VPRRHAASGDDIVTLAAYLREIAKVPLLTPAEERELGARIQGDRDEAALARLVESNLRFVVSCARRYRRPGVPLIDLIHEGNLGLMEAARRFNPARNVKFITYAVWWVREAMAHALADQVRAFSFPPKLLPRLGSRTGDLSLDEAVEAGGGRPLAETLTQDRVPPIDVALIRRSDLADLDSALRELDGREQKVVRLRFGLDDDRPRTLREIGDRLHLSRERVRQIESRAKDKLRQSAKLRSRLN
jgi:RNA polymerase primary sigma factor